jgi:hypothetical protein
MFQRLPDSRCGQIHYWTTRCSNRLDEYWQVSELAEMSTSIGHWALRHHLTNAFVSPKTITRYFTEDAYILHPLVNQPEFARGRENLKALYFILWAANKSFTHPLDEFAHSTRSNLPCPFPSRKGTFENKIHFHAVMFSEDLTQCTLGMWAFFSPALTTPVTGYTLNLCLTISKCTNK